MNKYQVFIFSMIISLLHCGLPGNSDNAFSEECANLQELVNKATNEYSDAKDNYNKDPDNAVVCEIYVESMEYRIEVMQWMIDYGCLTTGSLLMTQAAIEENQKEIAELSC